MDGEDHSVAIIVIIIMLIICAIDDRNQIH